MNSTQLVNQAFNLLSQGQLESAYEISKKLLLAPTPSAVSYFLACEISVAKNNLMGALENILIASQRAPNETQFQFRKAEIQLMLRHGIDAQNTATLAAESHPNNPVLQLNAAIIFRQCDNHQGAEKFLLNALNKGYSSQRFLFELAKNQFYLGKMSTANDIIDKYLASYPRNDGSIHLLRSQLAKQSEQSNHIQALQQHLSHATSSKEKINLHFALAKELEDTQKYSVAYQELNAGAKLQRKSLNFTLQSELSNIQNLIDTFQPENYAQISAATLLESPIFIVGMPRTGTTLVERIISQHQNIKSAGETSDFTIAMTTVINQYIQNNTDKNLSPLSASLAIDYTKIGEIYLTNMKNMLGETRQTVDKLPFNFLYCGLIKKAFPNARIIHLVRDPIDTCYAIFKTLFNQIYYFSYDLDELADYYIAYRKLMAHWHALMPGDILDIQYEKLVQDPLTESKKISEFCHLRWSEDLIKIENANTASSTASAAQIRQPIYTGSVKKWQNYEKELSPLIDKLKGQGLIE